MPEIKPVFKKLLIIALAMYVISSCIMQVDICRRINKIEHALLHITGACSHHH
ncbi:MAG: hypothetical protein ISS47_03145 [Candidatus Omnitrophica bacterium]|nr:hypothetical protein [Candidatus Omnitrophota bacterium]